MRYCGIPIWNLGLLSLNTARERLIIAHKPGGVEECLVKASDESLHVKKATAAAVQGAVEGDAFFDCWWALFGNRAAEINTRSRRDKGGWPLS